jgi:hypothetical protein
MYKEQLWMECIAKKYIIDDDNRYSFDDNHVHTDEYNNIGPLSVMHDHIKESKLWIEIIRGNFIDNVDNYSIVERHN